MNLRAAIASINFNILKIVAAVFILLSGIFAFYYFSFSSVLLKIFGLFITLGIVIAIILQTEQGRLLWQFISDARMEVRKVVWPNRQETFQTTMVVVIMVFLVGFLLWLFDMTLVTVLRFLADQRN